MDNLLTQLKALREAAAISTEVNNGLNDRLTELQSQMQDLVNKKVIALQKYYDLKANYLELLR